MLYKDEGRKTEHDKVLHYMLIDARQSSLLASAHVSKEARKKDVYRLNKVPLASVGQIDLTTNNGIAHDW